MTETYEHVFYQCSIIQEFGEQVLNIFLIPLNITAITLTYTNRNKTTKTDILRNPIIVLVNSISQI